MAEGREKLMESLDFTGVPNPIANPAREPGEIPNLGQITSAIALHKTETDPHTQYAQKTTVNGLVDRLLVLESRPFQNLSINCGQLSGNPTIDPSGNYWIRDCYFSGGNSGDNGVSNTSNTNVPAIYQTERFGDTTYTIPVVEGIYTVALHFAENYYTAIDQRVFSVDIQSTRVLTNFDIFKEVGGRKALIKSFTGIVSSSQQIVIKIVDMAGTIMALQLTKEG